MGETGTPTHTVQFFPQHLVGKQDLPMLTGCHAGFSTGIWGDGHCHLLPEPQNISYTTQSWLVVSVVQMASITLTELP